MVLTFGISVVLVDSLFLRLGLVGTAIVLVAFLSRIPVAQARADSVTMELSAAQESPR